MQPLYTEELKRLKYCIYTLITLVHSFNNSMPRISTFDIVLCLLAQLLNIALTLSIFIWLRLTLPLVNLPFLL